MECLRIALLVIFLICVGPRQSDGSFLKNFRNLAEGGHNPKTTTDQMSPSPSPVQSPVSLPKGDNCDKVVRKCEIKDYSLTACVPFVEKGSQSSYVLVVNDGESSLQLNMTVRPANIIHDIEISGHQVKKVNLSSNTVGTSSILVHVKNGDCVIQIGASKPQDFYTSYLTRINGTYLLLFAAVLIAGTWTCCKLVKTGQHLDGGIPYQELEMEHQESNSSITIESPDGWDQNWDDEWDEEKAVRSPGGNHIGEVLAPP